MKLKKGGVRGNNAISNALNKPIGSKLSKKLSPKVAFIILLSVFIVLLIFAITVLGLKTGIYFSLGFSALGIFVYWDNNCQIDKQEKKAKKRVKKPGSLF